MGLNTGGNQLPWSHPLIITSLVLAGVALSAFCYIESSPRWAPEPMIPVSLIIRTRTVLAACLANWFSTMCAFLTLYYVPLYLQLALHLSSSQAGLRVIPFAVATSAGSLGVGYVMRATGRYYILTAAVMAILVLGATLVCTFRRDSPAWATYVFITPEGFGYGGMLTITLVAMIGAVEHKYQAVITAASYAFRSTGSTIGITIASAVYQNILTQELRDTYGDMPNSEKVIRRIRNSLKGTENLPPGWSKDKVVDIYMDAFRGAFVAGLGLAVLATISALLMKEHVLYRNLARKRSDASGS